MKFAYLLAATVVCTACDVTQPPVTSSAAAAPPTIGWENNEYKDELRGTVRKFSSIDSKNGVQLSSGGSDVMARVSMTKSLEAIPMNVVMRFSKPALLDCDRIDSAGSHAKVSFKFDEGQVIEAAGICNDGRNSLTLTREDADQFIMQVGRAPKNLLVEAPMFPDQRAVFRFDVPPLKGEWQSYSASLDQQFRNAQGKQASR